MSIPASLRSPAAPVLLLILAVATLLGGCDPGASTEATRLAIHAFEIAPDRLSEPGEVTVRWKVSLATTLEILQGDEPIERVDPSVESGALVLPVSRTSTFTLRAGDAAGRLVTASRTVTVDAPAGPRITTLNAPEVVGADETGEATALIEWSVEGARELRLQTEGREPIALDPDVGEGRIEVVLREETTFTLVAASDEGEESRSVTIRVAYHPSGSSRR